MEVNGLEEALQPQMLSSQLGANPASTDFEAHLAHAAEKSDSETNTRAEDAKLKEACRELSSFFLSYILKGMWETIPQSDAFSENKAAQIYQEMMTEKLAETISKSGSMDLGSIIYNQLAKDQNLDQAQGLEEDKLSTQEIEPDGKTP